MGEGRSERPVVAIVPARGGSKRIPRKNIKPFLGTPLIVRTIGTLVDSHLFDIVIVSTDDEEIAHLAVEAGASAPFRRPAELADDLSGTAPVIRHAVQELEPELGTTVGIVCAVYPAAVFTRSRDLIESLPMMDDGEVDFVFAATTFAYPIQRALRRLPDGSCEMLWPQHLMTRSQDLEETYHDAGQFYWGRRDAWLSERAVFSARSRLYLMPRHRVQDIDTAEDWESAELLFEILEKSD